MANRILLVRHAEIAPEYLGRYIGASDAPLGTLGLNQAQALSELVQSKSVRRCFCSPLLRARQTAEIIFQSTSISVQIDPDLREIDFGQYEGKTFKEIMDADPSLVRHWAKLDNDFAFPLGETFGNFLVRVQQAADRLQNDPAEVILAVTHSGVIRTLLCHWLGLNPRHFMLFPVQCATITTIDLHDGQGMLKCLNEKPN